MLALGASAVLALGVYTVIGVLLANRWLAPAELRGLGECVWVTGIILWPLVAVFVTVVGLIYVLCCTERVEAGERHG